MYQPVQFIIYVSTSAIYNLVCLIDHASFINFDTSIWQCFITKINLSDNDMYITYKLLVPNNVHGLVVVDVRDINYIIVNDHNWFKVEYPILYKDEFSGL